jgi:integrase
MATKRAYGSDFAIFRAWCADQGLSALPADPAAVAAFIAAEAGRGVKCSTLGRRHPKGVVLTLRRSKTDQAGVGKSKAIPHGRRLGVVAALDAWRAAAEITTGPIFRGVRASRVLPDRLCSKQVARIIKARAKAAGLDPKLFSGHSLRSGFITTAADHGATLQAIANHAAHEKIDTTLGYVQVADAFRDHSGRGFSELAGKAGTAAGPTGGVLSRDPCCRAGSGSGRSRRDQHRPMCRPESR